MPFAGYDDFDACVLANKDKKNPKAYCGTIERLATGKTIKKSALDTLLTKLRRSVNTTEEVIDHDPVELTLTKAPAVREEILMKKSDIELNDEELQELRKSLGLDEGADIPDDEKKKAEDAKIEGLKKAGKITDDDLKRLREGGGDDDDEEDDEEKKRKKKEEEDETMKKSVSQKVTAAQKVLADVMDSLPEDVQKFFKDSSVDTGVDTAEVAKSVVAEIKKSFGDVVESAETKALRAEVAELKKSITDLTGKAADAELLEIAKRISATPEKEIATLRTLRKSMSDEDFKGYVEGQERMFRAANNSEAFRQVSSGANNGASTVGGASAKLVEIAKSQIKKSEDGNSNDQAQVAKVLAEILENPGEHSELVDQYHKEQQTAAAKPSGVGA